MGEAKRRAAATVIACRGRYRSDLPALPARMGGLPIDNRGFPVPFFASWVDGEPEFRVVHRETIMKAVRRKLCWICGQPLGSWVAFAIGPMCTVNRISAEPPQHRECAIYAAQACPFMAHPDAVRRKSRMPEGAKTAEECPGVMLERNPGVVAVWCCRRYEVFRPHNGGTLHRLGDPGEVLWFTRGRDATRDEVEEALERGFPALREMAEQDGPDAVVMLDTALSSVRANLLPAT